MIELGLSRITRLLAHTPQTWNAIHVAGTNGKGSTCAYLSAMLHATGRSTARFNSPHFIDRWDCITINEKPVSEGLFLETERLIKERDSRERIGASEFELLTATAFEIMTRENVEFGVIEVGVGGSLDATNALKHKAVTVITKIGLDHQFLLGDTIEEIALTKAGIMRTGIPCVVDQSNTPSVLRVIQEHAKSVGAQVSFPPIPSDLTNRLSAEGFEPHQTQNIASALEAFRLACPNEDGSLKKLLPIIYQTQLPGRLQKLPISPGRDVLLDGAHNVQSAEVLAGYVSKHLRGDGKPVTWILAASQGKDVSGILEVLLKPKDIVTAVQFGPVEGMPWVKPQEPRQILDAAGNCGADTYESEASADISNVLNTAVDKRGPVVVAGSLYLVSDILRWMRDQNSP
ncbi:putative dihydrofolate synthetase [Cytospora mali]|uniref:Dihydrofolate synthetase n=1 Tax=Cytospora mali TaxID=578113 RepID=A0A194WDI9_CYTMA|nr:putative dihydrofolate synthetase [Valsa mali]